MFLSLLTGILNIWNSATAKLGSTLYFTKKSWKHQGEEIHRSFNRSQWQQL